MQWLSKKDREGGYLHWLRENFSSTLPLISDTVVSTALSLAGIGVHSYLDETDSLKIRLFTSALILRRDKCKVENSVEYLAIIQKLLCYAEYLESDEKIPAIDDDGMTDKNILKTSQDRKRMKDSLTVAYYLSRHSMEGVNKLGYKTTTAAFKELGKILGRKPATIKNMRDAFDPYFDNGRAGWHQKPLSKSRKEIFDYYGSVSDVELEQEVKAIVQEYYELYLQPSKTSSGNRKMIKVNPGMKEIKAKRK